MRGRAAIAAIAAYLLLAGLGFTMSLPLLWMLSTSLKDPRTVGLYPPRWIPTRPGTVAVRGKEYPAGLITERGRKMTVAIVGRRPGQVVILDARGVERLVPESAMAPQEQVHLEWRNYVEAWKALPVESGFLGLLHNADGFLVFYLNSLLVTICVTAGQLITCSLAAFAFARLRFPGRDVFFLGYVATLMVPAVVTMIPLFGLMRIGRLTDTYWALILPGLFSAYGTFLLRQFFMTVPTELEDAAKIDGAGPFAIYWRIVMPLCKPALATLGTFTFLHTWNEFLWPLIVIDDLGKKTLPIGLAHFQGPYLTEWHLLMAASVIVMFPVLIVFVIGQRYFVRGIALSGLKA
jgi:multiple sugar transport system permease protein